MRSEEGKKGEKYGFAWNIDALRVGVKDVKVHRAASESARRILDAARERRKSEIAKMNQGA